MASLRDRFFVEGVHAVGERVAFAPDDARKIATVLRGRSGDRVEVVDSGGKRLVGDARRARRRPSRRRSTKRWTRPSREPSARIAIAQAIPKGTKMDAVVEKATELGAAALLPLRTLRVAGDHTGEAKVERWQRIAKQRRAAVRPHGDPERRAGVRLGRS